MRTETDPVFASTEELREHLRMPVALDVEDNIEED